MLTLAAISSYLIPIFVVLFVFICGFMMLVILIQKPKGGGLSGAFGGAGGAVQNAFGSKVGDMLTWVTVVCFALFLLLAMGLTWTIAPASANKDASGLEAPAPAATTTTAPATQPAAK